MSPLPRVSWSPAEVAVMIGIHQRSVLAQIHAGVIPADRFGTNYRIPNAWVQERLGSSDGDLVDALSSLTALPERAAVELMAIADRLRLAAEQLTADAVKRPAKMRAVSA